MNSDTTKKVLAKIAKEAGAEIMKIYLDPQQSAVVDWKSDDSPLTLADQAANKIIVDGLKKNFPEIPIISEEEQEVPYSKRKDYQKFWLVDPLDGTKEFINRNGEFTVNIALIEDKKPIVGIIYVPVTDVLYYGHTKDALATKENNNQTTSLKVLGDRKNRIAVRSKSHASEEEATVLDYYNVTEEISVGSSLKFCMVAEGKADLYYRHGPTMEWDTAAGQAIAEAAGATVYIEKGPEPFRYNKENLLNTGFLVLAV